jgi:hypothetical protein
MRTLTSVVIVFACVGLALLGCADRSQPLGAPTDKAVSASLAKGGNLHSATGTGHWAYCPAFGVSRIRFAFSGIQHADGTVSGELQLDDSSQACYLHAKVTQLKIDPDHSNMAELICTVDKGGAGKGAPTFVSTLFVVVVDNGEGKNATGPDQISYIDWFTPDLLLGYPYNGSKTMAEVLALTPSQYLDWEAGNWADYLAPEGGSFLRVIEHGSVQVK